MCDFFREYKEVSKTVPLDLSEDNVIWVAYNLSGAAGLLVYE